MHDKEGRCMNQPKVEVSVASVKDILALQTILKENYDGQSPWSHTIFWLELSRKKNGCYYKAVMDKKIVGFIGIRISQDDAHVTNIAVHPDYQRLGIGTILLNHFLQYAVDNDCKQLSLEVKSTNELAIKLYERYGFVQVGLKKNYYKETKEDAIDMFYYL